MIDKAKFFKRSRELLFSKLNQDQVEGTEAILDAWEKWAPASDLRFIAYSLATTYHETARTMQPIEEYGKGRGRSYGAPVGKWKKVYYGRGYVQLTWQKNYKFATKRLRELGVITSSDDLEKNPELAMRHDVAAAILVVGMLEGWFTGKKLSQYFTKSKSDWVNARRIINGVDKASTIGVYAQQFLDSLDEK
jgi:putative chitinase